MEEVVNRSIMQTLSSRAEPTIMLTKASGFSCQAPVAGMLTLPRVTAPGDNPQGLAVCPPQSVPCLPALRSVRLGKTFFWNENMNIQCHCRTTGSRWDIRDAERPVKGEFILKNFQLYKVIAVVHVMLDGSAYLEAELDRVDTLN